jgi:hypothetical protein
MLFILIIVRRQIFNKNIDFRFSYSLNFFLKKNKKKISFNIKQYFKIYLKSRKILLIEVH